MKKKEKGNSQGGEEPIRERYPEDERASIFAEFPKAPILGDVVD